jgi:hypothetical protein
MKLVKFLFVLLLVFSVQSCKKKSSNSNRYNNNTEHYSYEEEEEPYPDDTYCSDVDYYNPDTGSRSSYTLNVDVEYNEVVKIYFSSGWLDSSEFSSEELDEDGYCDITLYDGRKFEIQITGAECSYNDGYRIESDIEDAKAAITCARCGFSKYEYDDYCDDCTNLLENTCSRCNGYEYGVYGGICSSCKDKTCSRCGQYDTFMWSGDELCSDCKG